MELKDRIAEALRVAKKSQTQVAAEAGVTVSTISQLMNGKIKSLRASTASELEKATGVRMQWLISEEGPMGISDTPPSIRVKMLANHASMGSGSDLLANDVISDYLSLTTQFVKVHLSQLNPYDLRFIHAYGDSMEPTLKSGDILLIDIGVQEIKIDGIYVLRAYERLFVKRIRQCLDGRFEVSSDNPTHKTVDMLNGEHEVGVIGRVVWYWNGHGCV